VTTPPTGRRVTRPDLQEGQVLAGRYRLTRRITRRQEPDVAGAVLWQAEDEVLARCVAVKVLTAGGRRDASATRFLDAGAAAGGIDLPAFARVYDAAVEERDAERHGEPAGTMDVAYVISEWVDGRTVAELLAAEGPLDATQALDLVVAAADALSVAARRGLSHGFLHPGNLAVTSDGRVKVLDLGVAAALRPEPSPADPARDTRDLAAVLYALLTAGGPPRRPAPRRPGCPRRSGATAACCAPGRSAPPCHGRSTTSSCTPWTPRARPTGRRCAPPPHWPPP
jgi:serine/threonine protein kinase